MTELLLGDFVTWTHDGEVRRRCVLVFCFEGVAVVKVGDDLYAKTSVTNLVLEDEPGSAENAREWLERVPGRLMVEDGEAETAEEFADEIIREEDEKRRGRLN